VTGKPVAPATLDELPEHRREHLLWKHALELDYAGVQDLVLELAQYPCLWDWANTPEGLSEAVAVFGADGRWHLRLANELICGEDTRRPRGLAAGLFVHEQGCHWWTDGVRYRIQAPVVDGPDGPRLAAGGTGRAVRWTFALTDMISPAETVPPAERCPCGGVQLVWPAYHTSATPLGRIRIQLTKEFGGGCHACRRGLAAAVDHDHRTGLVRGLLCRNCNSRIDSCPHLAGCPWADYLNNPPAAALKLRYPKPRKPASTGYLARVEYLGFGLFD
jgi:Recombination endonuclease VII